MHSHSQILELIRNGVHPQVTFSKGCEDLEGYAETGMKARLIRAEPFAPDDGVLRLMVDFTDYDQHNRQFESANYYDKDGNPTLTAREYGSYKPIETYYVSLQEGPEYLTIDSDERTALFARYLSSGSEGSYVVWLEDELLRTRS